MSEGAKTLDVSRVCSGAGPFPLFVTLAVAPSGAVCAIEIGKSLQAGLGDNLVS